MAPDLAEKMRLRADADKLPADHALRIKADAFDEHAEGITPRSKQSMSANSWGAGQELGRLGANILANH